MSILFPKAAISTSMFFPMALAAMVSVPLFVMTPWGVMPAIMVFTAGMVVIVLPVPVSRFVL